MQGLEYILKEMKEIKDRNREEKLYAKYPPHSEDQRAINAYSKGYEDGTDNFYNALMYIIRKHMSGKGSNVHTNDGWIPVEERLPEKNEYFVDTSRNKDFPNGYYRRLEIAYMTDTIEYVHGYYDGYKWMDKYLNAIKNVVAWRIHEPYQPKTITQRPEWKDRMLHTFLGGRT